MQSKAGAYRIGFAGRLPMPKGARHVETGVLRPGRWGYSLEMDGGGVWQLDMPRSARRFLGQRVTVEGTRSGFNLLDVRCFRVADAITPAIRLIPTSGAGIAYKTACEARTEEKGRGAALSPTVTR